MNRNDWNFNWKPMRRYKITTINEGRHFFCWEAAAAAAVSYNLLLMYTYVCHHSAATDDEGVGAEHGTQRWGEESRSKRQRFTSSRRRVYDFVIELIEKEGCGMMMMWSTKSMKRIIILRLRTEQKNERNKRKHRPHTLSVVVLDCSSWNKYTALICVLKRKSSNYDECYCTWSETGKRGDSRWKPSQV